MFRRFERLMGPESEGSVLDGGTVEVPESKEGVTTEAAPTGVGVTDEPDVPEWIKEIDEEYREEKSLHAIKDISALAKGYVHAQKLIGKDKVALPDKNSSSEEIQAFYNKLGRPESADEYGLKEEGEDRVFNDAFLKEFQQVAHENNLLPKQAQAVLDKIKEARMAEDTLLEQEANETIKEGLEELTKEWGEEGFKANAARANHVLKEFGFEGLNEYLRESGLGNDPMLIRLLANIGSGLNEDTFKDSVRESFGMTKEDAQEELAKIMADLDGPYYNSDNLEHAIVSKKVTKLHEILAS